MSITVRLSDSTLNRVKELSERDGITVERFIELAVTEKVSALNALEYLNERASRGSKETLERVLAGVSSRPPEEFDKILE